jgi:hypothetical protein
MRTNFMFVKVLKSAFTLLDFKIKTCKIPLYTLKFQNSNSTNFMRQSPKKYNLQVQNLKSYVQHSNFTRPNFKI